MWQSCGIDENIRRRKGHFPDVWVDSPLLTVKEKDRRVLAGNHAQLFGDGLGTNLGRPRLQEVPIAPSATSPNRTKSVNTHDTHLDREPSKISTPWESKHHHHYILLVRQAAHN